MLALLDALYRALLRILWENLVKSEQKNPGTLRVQLYTGDTVRTSCMPSTPSLDQSWPHNRRDYFLGIPYCRRFEAKSICEEPL